MFLTAAPVNTDIGRSLMHKMGWKQGEGLGKNKEGALNPLLLEIKTDRQGINLEFILFVFLFFVGSNV